MKIIRCIISIIILVFIISILNNYVIAQEENVEKPKLTKAEDQILQHSLSLTSMYRYDIAGLGVKSFLDCM